MLFLSQKINTLIDLTERERLVRERERVPELAKEQTARERLREEARVFKELNLLNPKFESKAHFELRAFCVWKIYMYMGFLFN